MANSTKKSVLRDDRLRFTAPVFRSHALALGQLALAWNGLHQMLALLFCSIMGGGIVNQHLAIWNAIKSDRAQRDILLAALKSDHAGFRPPGFFEGDIEWLCRYTDQVEEARNNAIHSPLWAAPNEHRSDIRPSVGLGHARAIKLLGKDLLLEFRWCRDSAIALGAFAAQLDRALVDPLSSWPEKPQLPNRGAPNMKKPRRQAQRAIRVRPPQSSPA